MPHERDGLQTGARHERVASVAKELGKVAIGLAAWAVVTGALEVSEILPPGASFWIGVAAGIAAFLALHNRPRN